MFISLTVLCHGLKKNIMSRNRVHFWNYCSRDYNEQAITKFHRNPCYLADWPELILVKIVCVHKSSYQYIDHITVRVSNLNDAIPCNSMTSEIQTILDNHGVPLTGNWSGKFQYFEQWCPLERNKHGPRLQINQPSPSPQGLGLPLGT